MKHHIYIFCLLLLPFSAIAQNEQSIIDSLGLEIQQAESDTTRSMLLLEQGYHLMPSDSLAAIQKFNEAIKLANAAKWDKKYQIFHEIAMIYGHYGDEDMQKAYLWKSINECNKTANWFEKGRGHHDLGITFHISNEYDSARYHYNRVIELGVKHKLQRLLASGYNDRGNLALYESDLPTALDFYLKGLKVREAIHDTLGINGSTNNIGLVYNHLKDYKNALKYHKKALDIANSRNDNRMKTAAYANMGGDYLSLHKYDSAYNCSYEAFRLRKMNGDSLELSRSYGQLGGILVEMVSKNQLRAGMSKEQMLDSALIYSQKALSPAKMFDDRYGQTYILQTIGKVYHLKGKFDDAIKYYQQSAELAKELGGYLEIKEVSRELANLKAKKGDYKAAFYWLNEYIDAKDSLYNEDKARELTRRDMQYEFDKQNAVETAIHKQELEKQQAIADADKKRQTIIIAAISIGLLMVIIFSFFLYKRFKITSKQKEVIEQQKHIVEEAHYELEEKNQEILDSINYAKRIQSAILPPNKIVKEYLPNSFILYKPKDIVAGDFYWMETVSSLEGGLKVGDHHPSNSPQRENLVLFAAADCTGHGVPGAMVSVICHNALNRSVREHNLADPGKILDKTREIIIREFEKSEEEVKDGMDIALCALKLQTTTAILQYAGAHNPLWIIRKGAEEIEEIKADKQPIGKFDHPQPHTTHNVKLNKGDSFYIFSDGYADQFGGEKGKKFKTANLKKLLLSIQHETIEKQKELIDRAFENWKGNLEQLDDVCVIGVKI